MEKRKNLSGSMLRDWRKARNVSQLELAMRAETSQRNISFVESGRTDPSREMVLKLIEALDLPLRARNEILLAAGYAPLYPERPLSGADMTLPSEMLDRMLEHHEPYPAIVIDGAWNVVRNNRAAARIIAHCVPPRVIKEISAGGALNFLRLMCTPEGMKSRIRNWPHVGAALMARLRREAVAYPGSPSEVLLRELLAAKLLPPFQPADTPLEAVIPVDFDLSGTRLRLFNTLTTFGTPQDVTLQELRIEMSFPADEASDKLLHRWGDESSREMARSKTSASFNLRNGRHE